MNVVFRDMTADYSDVVGVTDFSYQISDSSTYVTRQNGFMVLSGPD